MKKIFLLGLFFSTIFTSISCVQMLVHDEVDAAKAANEFANTAFIEKDYQKTYLLFADVAKKSVTLDNFSNAISNMHPTGFPTEVRATEFEPASGQKGMSIFLKGKNEKEEFYYRFYMAGTKLEGYKVGGFFRGNGPYPPSKLRKSLE